MLELWRYGIWLNKGKIRKTIITFSFSVLSRDKIYNAEGNEVSTWKGHKFYLNKDIHTSRE